jgi:hypothetical protein
MKSISLILRLAAASRLRWALVLVALCLHAQRALPFAIGTVQGIDLNGHNLTTDSFDSGDTNYSTGGQYDYAKRKGNGDIITSGSIWNSVGIGQAAIVGQVRIGPDPTNRVDIGPTGSVGDRAWVEGRNLGVQPGHLANDLNVTFADVVLPSLTWMIAVPNNVTIDGTTYQYTFLNSGNYSLLGASAGSIYIGTNAFVNLKVAGSFNLNGYTNAIRISPGGSLRIYMTGGSFRLGGLGVINETGLADGFIYYGLPQNTNVVFSANPIFVGCICAPSAAVSVAAGGNDPLDFVGTCLAKCVRLNPWSNFHFDEGLERRIPLLPPWVRRQPHDQTVVAGQSATFTVTGATAIAWPCQWRLNGANIPGATNYSLTLSNLAAQDAGSYSAVISNQFGVATSKDAILTVLAPPAVPVLRISATADLVRLEILGPPGANYAVECSSDLTSWVPLITNTAPFSYPDTDFTNYAQRFFRAVPVP